MDIRIKKNKDEIYLLELSGALDLYSSGQLKDLVIKMIGKKAGRFIISFDGVDSVNSEGLGALIYVSSTLKKLNFPLVLTVPEGPVMEALEVSRLKNYFTVAASLKEAAALISGR